MNHCSLYIVENNLITFQQSLVLLLFNITDYILMVITICIHNEFCLISYKERNLKFWTFFLLMYLLTLKMVNPESFFNEVH